MKKEKLQIKLAEIPEEGREFSYSQSSGELNLPLRDLIEDQPYQITFQIRPVGNIYELSGNLETTLPRICSRCGWDIEVPVKARLHEFLVPKKDIEKGDTESKSGFLGEGDEESAVTYITGGVLDTTEMVHELVALQDPLYPSCEKEVCENLESVRAKISQLEREAEDAVAPIKSPFEALKTLKLPQ